MSKRKQCTDDEIKTGLLLHKKVKTYSWMIRMKKFCQMTTITAAIRDTRNAKVVWRLSKTRTRTSELETESETDTDQVDNVPDNERQAVILLLFMGVGEPICAPSRWWILPVLNCTTARYGTGDSVLWCFDCHILLVCQSKFFSFLFIYFFCHIFRTLFHITRLQDMLSCGLRVLWF